MESKTFTIFKLYDGAIVAKDEHEFTCCIEPSLLTQFFELDKTYKVWCYYQGNGEYEIRAISDKGKGMLFATSSEPEFDQKVFDKLRKFGAHYNFAKKQWQIDMHIMRDEQNIKEIKKILPGIAMPGDEFDF